MKHRDLVVEEYASGFDLPTALVFTGPDRLLVIEKRTGKVQIVEEGQIVGTALDLDVNSFSERGGLGIALDPDFENNGFVYIFHSVADGADVNDPAVWQLNSLTRFHLANGLLDDPVELLTVPRRNDLENGPNHNGGTIRFGPDGFLYGLVGDLSRGFFFRPGIEQNTTDDVSSEAGGIFRIATDGSIPADNPFADHPIAELRKWYVYGVRNGFGMAFDPRTGRLWFTENGPDIYDEINIAVPGGNSGWRLLMGPDRRDARLSFKGGGKRAHDADDLVMLPGAEYFDPVFSWLDQIGVTAMTFLHGDVMPRAIRDRLLVGDFNNGDLYLFKLRGKGRRQLALRRDLRDGVADTERERRRNVWGSGFGPVTDLRIGPDGSLYVLGFRSGTLWRIRRK